eukprot:SAG31_NODE_12807_length_915_cov_1.003676_2_plen_83_part_01
MAVKILRVSTLEKAPHADMRVEWSSISRISRHALALALVRKDRVLVAFALALTLVPTLALALTLALAHPEIHSILWLLPYGQT